MLTAGMVSARPYEALIENRKPRFRCRQRLRICSSLFTDSCKGRDTPVHQAIRPRVLAADAAKLIYAPKCDRRDIREANMRRGLV